LNDGTDPIDYYLLWLILALANVWLLAGAKLSLASLEDVREQSQKYLVFAFGEGEPPFSLFLPFASRSTVVTSRGCEK